jgi:hypothetical protein
MVAQSPLAFIADFNDVGQGRTDSGRTEMYAVELNAATGITNLLDSSTSSTTFDQAITNILNILLNQLYVEAGETENPTFPPFAPMLTDIARKTGLSVPGGLTQTQLNTYMTSELLASDPNIIKFIKYGISFIGAHYYIYFTHFSTQTVKTTFNDLNADLFPSFYTQLSAVDALDRITCFVEVAQKLLVYRKGPRNSENFNTFKSSLHFAITPVTSLRIPDTVVYNPSGPIDIEYIYMTGNDINTPACVFVTEMILMGLYHYAWYGRNVYKI